MTIYSRLFEFCSLNQDAIAASFGVPHVANDLTLKEFSKTIFPSLAPAARQDGNYNAFFGRKHSEETKRAMSEARVGNTYARGSSWSHDEATKKHLSAKAIGRRKQVLPDGSWTWRYPIS